MTKGKQNLRQSIENHYGLPGYRNPPLFSKKEMDFSYLYVKKILNVFNFLQSVKIKINNNKGEFSTCTSGKKNLVLF
ncbi:hypothetical protein SAMN05216353_109107 [Halobacillus alkaliphilus]|uniref:Uncharacterized protein n=1 Tax=Halobacillus alkaliphilus TaxID=396056 RepID=A0A1I2LTE7_9BACI|nr:hypothetical protein SAMN05216353_109107 [Halobacillus alkaliphilus]